MILKFDDTRSFRKVERTAKLFVVNEEKDAYVVECLDFGSLTEVERARCLQLIADGGAVTMKWARRDFPRSLQIAISRKNGEIVGVGAIKPVRDHAITVAELADFTFSPDTPELGYFVVDRRHRGNKLSSRMATTLSRYPGPLFATTSEPNMKAALIGAGFVQRGHEWRGRRGDMITLWIRSSK